MALAAALAATSALLAGCGEPSAPDLGPAKVVIESVTAVSGDNSDAITAQLKNTGGAGFYYVEFLAAPFDPSEDPLTGQSAPVEVAAGYNDTVIYLITNGTISTVRVYSRPTDSQVYTRTDCRHLRGTLYC